MLQHCLPVLVLPAGTLGDADRVGLFAGSAGWPALSLECGAWGIVALAP